MGAGDVHSLLPRILPTPGLPRSIAIQSAIVAVGNGTFMTGGMVLFTDVIGLSPAQIGVGVSLAGLVGLVGSVPLGALVDRAGGRRSWGIGVLVKAACFAAYPTIRHYGVFLLVTALAAVADGYVDVGRTVYLGNTLPAEVRVRVLAFARSYSNVGLTLGAGLGAAALAAGSSAALAGMALTSAAGLLASAVAVARLPNDARRTGNARRPAGVLRDYPYLVLSALLAVLWWHAVIFSQIVPLWLITRTDAPRPALGALFALNTVLAVLLQVPATRSAGSRAGSARLMRRGSWAAAVACPVLALSGGTHGWATIAALAAGIALITCTELWVSAATWFMQTEVPPVGQRGVYNGASRAVGSTGRMLAPAALTFLAIQTGGWGWWIVAGIFAACALATRPVVAWVARTPRASAAGAGFWRR